MINSMINKIADILIGKLNLSSLRIDFIVQARQLRLYELELDIIGRIIVLVNRLYI